MAEVLESRARHVSFCEEVDCIEYFVESDATDTEDEPEQLPVQPVSYPDVVGNVGHTAADASAETRRPARDAIQTSVRRPPVRPQEVTATKPARLRPNHSSKSGSRGSSVRRSRTPAVTGKLCAASGFGRPPSADAKPSILLRPVKISVHSKNNVSTPVGRARLPRANTASVKVAQHPPSLSDTTPAEPPQLVLPAGPSNPINSSELVPLVVPSGICEDIRRIARILQSQAASVVASFTEFRKRKRLATVQLAYAQWNLKLSAEGGSTPPTLCFEVAALRTLIPKLTMKMAMEALRFCVQHRHVVNRALLGAEKARRSQVLQRSFVCLDSWRIRRKRLRCLYQRQWIRLAASAFRSWRQSCEYLHSLRRVVLPAFATWLTFLQRKLEKRATLLKYEQYYTDRLLRRYFWILQQNAIHRVFLRKVLKSGLRRHKRALKWRRIVEENEFLFVLNVFAAWKRVASDHQRHSMKRQRVYVAVQYWMQKTIVRAFFAWRRMCARDEDACVIEIV